MNLNGLTLRELRLIYAGLEAKRARLQMRIDSSIFVPNEPLSPRTQRAFDSSRACTERMAQVRAAIEREEGTLDYLGRGRSYSTPCFKI